jgi:hypothetical protein
MGILTLPMRLADSVQRPWLWALIIGSLAYSYSFALTQRSLYAGSGLAPRGDTIFKDIVGWYALAI